MWAKVAGFMFLSSLIMSMEIDDGLCQIRVMIGNMAFSLVLVPMLIKTYTIKRIMSNKKFRKYKVSALQMAAYAIGYSLAVVIFIVLHGLAWGVRGPQMQAIRADYFGSTSFASIMGWSNIIVTMGAIAGPLIAGSLADATGDYRLGFTILGVAAACGTVFWIFATPPSEPT